MDAIHSMKYWINRDSITQGIQILFARQAELYHLPKELKPAEIVAAQIIDPPPSKNPTLPHLELTAYCYECLQGYKFNFLCDVLTSMGVSVIDYTWSHITNKKCGRIMGVRTETGYLVEPKILNTSPYLVMQFEQWLSEVEELHDLATHISPEMFGLVSRKLYNSITRFCNNNTSGDHMVQLTRTLVMDLKKGIYGQQGCNQQDERKPRKAQRRTLRGVKQMDATT